MFNNVNSVKIKYIPLHDFPNEKIKNLTFLKGSPRIRILHKARDSLERTSSFRYEDFFEPVEDISASSWTNHISHVATHFPGGKYEITFKNGESISVTYDEIHSQQKIAKKIKSKFAVSPPKLIPSEYEKVELFIILKGREETVRALVKHERPSQKRGSNDRSEFAPYIVKETIVALNSRYTALGV